MRGGIGFDRLVNGSRKSVMGLDPGASSAETGLKYYVYLRRFAEVSNVPLAVGSLMPDDHALRGNGSEYEHFQGFIVDGDEVDRLADALASGAGIAASATPPSAGRLPREAAIDATP